MEISRAQEQMRDAYFGGAPGMLVSSIVWAAAGCVATSGAFAAAIWTLFIGGMTIHPLGILLAKCLGRSGNAKGNPLDRLALESTVTMILALPLAYGVSLVRIEWFFPAMLLVIGGRYFVFQSIYGARLYGVCGTVLAMAAYATAALRLVPASGAFVGSAVEMVFATALFAAMRSQRPVRLAEQGR